VLGNSADGLDRLIWYAAAPDPLHEQHGNYPPVPNFAIIRYSRKVCGQMEQVCEIPQHRDVYINHNDAVPLLLLPHSYLHPIQHIPACNAVKSGSVLAVEKKRKDYAFRRQFNEKPSFIPGCPGVLAVHIKCANHTSCHVPMWKTRVMPSAG